ncbi:hypothetical protein [Clostridium sp. CF012]|uniref:hypothetical protein n=1 Tax=Clostridium sp. CF012 TaxID=2843319 RepID=UPI001C0C81E1|nr:hypothetical protein [Clostridium sp. CF012]MBU3143991.1 hypothetical protein [Clostridium sp. CF012]
MNNIISIRNGHIMECSKLYVKVYNGEHWNDKWTLETYKRVNDIYSSPNFEGVLYNL